MQTWTTNNQGRLKEYIRHAEEWAGAKTKAQTENESGWDLVKRLSSGVCGCADGRCGWTKNADSFFERNAATVDRELLAATLAAVLESRPGKTRRIPMLTGCTNGGKSTIFDPVDNVFGEKAVQHTPALESTMPLANLASGEKRL